MTDDKRIRGVDVSQYQGIITDAVVKALVDEGCKFAYVRGAVGNEPKVDVRFFDNVEVFRRNGVTVGAYLFLFPLPHLDPEGQAEEHFTLTQGLGARVGELAPMADAEWPPREEYKTVNGQKTLTYPWQRWKCTAEQIRAWVYRYLVRLDQLSGCSCPLYTYRYWWRCVEGDKDPVPGVSAKEFFGRRPLVLADYGMQGRVPTDLELTRVKPIAPWDKITILQHDGDGGLRLPVSGADVDWNVMPNPADLDVLTGQPKPPEVTPGELSALVSTMHQGASSLLTEDWLRTYRQERVDEPNI